MKKKYLLSLFLFLSALSVTFGQCPTPGALSTANITQTTATLGWTTGGTEAQWEVLILPESAPEPTPNNQGITVPINSFTYTGLNPCSYYKYYVRANCSPGASSSWSAPFHFSTVVGNCALSVSISPSLDIPVSFVTAYINGGVPPYSYQWSVIGTS